MERQTKDRPPRSSRFLRALGLTAAGVAAASSLIGYQVAKADPVTDSPIPAVYAGITTYNGEAVQCNIYEDPQLLGSVLLGKPTLVVRNYDGTGRNQYFFQQLNEPATPPADMSPNSLSIPTSVDVEPNCISITPVPAAAS